MQTATEFFYYHAGRCYDPKSQRSRLDQYWDNAAKLAAAEKWANDSGAVYRWDDDPDGADVQMDSGEWEHLPAVTCALVVPCDECPHGCVEDCERKSHLHVAASLCGIIESDDLIERQAYRRVVAAELALEALPR